MNARDVKPNTLFKYSGKIYQWKKQSECWLYLCDEQGNKVPPSETPLNILTNKADVEVLGNIHENTDLLGEE